MSTRKDCKAKSVDAMTVQVHTVICPHCGSEQEGWIVDPRGYDHKCDDCHRTYHVPMDVTVQVF